MVLSLRVLNANQNLKRRQPTQLFTVIRKCRRINSVHTKDVNLQFGKDHTKTRSPCHLDVVSMTRFSCTANGGLALSLGMIVVIRVGILKLFRHQKSQWHDTSVSEHVGSMFVWENHTFMCGSSVSLD